MESIKVALGDRSYYIHIGTGVISQLGSCLQESSFGKRALIVTNRTVGSLYADIAVKNLREAGKQVDLAVIEDGEGHKTLSTAEYLYDKAFAAGLDRKSPIIALGGGVTGDLAGFVAATYMRGVPFVQVPTTLLAQVDSSVGGKVAVNRPCGKNIVGSFYQPACVLADASLLDTLPRRELRSGLAEVIKYGVIWNADFFSWLENHIELLLAGDGGALSWVVSQSCRIKAQVVELDEKENGLRAILNYGHTIGHAVETLSGYGTYTHGEAVSIGMVAAAKLSVALNLLNVEQLDRIAALLRRAGLPLEIPHGLAPEELLSSLYHDKKAADGRLTFVLPADIGRVIINNDLSPRLIREMLL